MVDVTQRGPYVDARRLAVTVHRRHSSLGRKAAAQYSTPPDGLDRAQKRRGRHAADFASVAGFIRSAIPGRHGASTALLASHIGTTKSTTSQPASSETACLAAARSQYRRSSSATLPSSTAACSKPACRVHCPRQTRASRPNRGHRRKLVARDQTPPNVHHPRCAALHAAPSDFQARPHARPRYHAEACRTNQT